ncbi:DUF3105 domain-containing protein [Luteipulveratus halotolerans]|uniref:DUF3105 domain-containing protein n=1 Tax=Luteipulveratus halotolerans TaxID=1631356 RepID=UPI000682144D|nr:DUF3105 domain-containing protein [Luteipulveratus halotolerans]
MRTIPAAVGAALLAAGLTGCQQAEAPPATTPAERIEGLGVVRSYTVTSRNHVTTWPSYAQHPAVGGDHYAEWASCGVYDAEVPEPNAVHSLEHGAVWITYKKPLSPENRSYVSGLASGQYVLVSSYARQEAPFVLTAWGKQVAVADLKDAAVADFLKKYVQGPQTPEPGAPCSGGYAPGATV